MQPQMKVTLQVNGGEHALVLEPRRTLLDALRYDLALTGKSKSLLQDAEKRGHHARLEAVSAESFALLSSLPRWLNALTETLPAGQQLPNLADLIQDRCERLLEQVCMPVHGG